MTDARWLRASAPVRLDFAGGWTDVAPFATEQGGVVVNAAIELRARAEVLPGGRGIRLDARDLGASAELGPGAWSEADRIRFPLQHAGLVRAGLNDCTLRTSSSVPPGSGLGSSGALGVALVAALDAVRQVERPPIEQAEAAFELEAVDAALPGGRQDQYAAALGGFHQLSFHGRRVAVERLQLDPALAAALERQLVVCYTGKSRVSSDTIARVMAAYAAREPTVSRALHGLAELAPRMSDALRAADLGSIGRLLSANWELQQQLDPGMRTGEMARLEHALTSAGALGGKAAGAGAGGSMFFLAPGDPAPLIAAARQEGASVLGFRWASRGVALS